MIKKKGRKNEIGCQKSRVGRRELKNFRKLFLETFGKIVKQREKIGFEILKFFFVVQHIIDRLSTESR